VQVVSARIQEDCFRICMSRGLRLETLTRSSSRMDIQITSAGTPLARVNRLSPMPASSCGKKSGTFGPQELAKMDVDEHLKILRTLALNNLLPIQGQLDLVDRETEIVPGIRAVAAPGHTPGHMALAISSGGEQLLVIADAVLHPIHLEQPEWYAVVDFIPEQAVATRRRLLNRAAAEKALVLAFHFPFPGLGHVVQKGEGWQWRPIETVD